MQKKLISYCLILMFINSLANAQDLSDSGKTHNPNKLSFTSNADLVSRFIWRGLPLSLSPNIQPYATISYGNMKLNTWGSYAITQPYAEVDLSLSYDLGLFTLGLNDYYNEDETDLSLNNYFNFTGKGSTATPNSLEGEITFNGTDNFPLSVTAATFVLGNDKGADNKNLFSTYLEIAYTLSISNDEIQLFLGGTTGESCYADKAAFVNAGLTASHDLKLSDSFSLPVFTSFIVNPDAKDVFLVFGITF